jgi:uncharacterized membrane protein
MLYVMDQMSKIDGMSTADRGVWLAIILLAAFVIAVLAGTLTWVSMRDPVTAPVPGRDLRAVAASIMFAGVAFGGAVLLMLTIHSFLG